jgi:hypothetical protein
LREQGGCSEKEWNPGNKSLHGGLITGFRRSVSTEFPKFFAPLRKTKPLG